MQRQGPGKSITCGKLYSWIGDVIISFLWPEFERVGILSLSGISFHVSHKFLSTLNVSRTLEDLLHQIGRTIPWIVILYSSQPA
jgi:hypothetical protein